MVTSQNIGSVVLIDYYCANTVKINTRLNKKKLLIHTQ